MQIFFCSQAREKYKIIFFMVVQIVWCMRLHKHIYLCAAIYVCMVHLLTIKYLSYTVADCGVLMSAAIGCIGMSITIRPMKLQVARRKHYLSVLVTVMRKS